MGIDTNALLNGHLDIMQIVDDLINLYGTDRADVSLIFTSNKNYYQIRFYQKKPEDFNKLSYALKRSWWGSNRRTLNVFVNGECSRDYADLTTEPMTYLSLGYWGDSVDIMKALLAKYGGYIMPNDCSDDWEAVFKD